MLPLKERKWLSGVLRDETVGGVLLLVATILALFMANGPWGDFYYELAHTYIGPKIEIGPQALHLDLNMSLAHWASDGLLAIFFFIAGVELRHELELGTLANPAKAVVPLAAAIGGMVLPAAIYAVANTTMADGEPGGWGIPMATDIAFALAVLAVVGRRLPVALRAFLLTLAVVDDLGAIIVIAVFYSKGFNSDAFFIALVLLAVYWLLQRERYHNAWVFGILAVLAWAFMYQSGVHATIAGVAIGMLTRVKADPGEKDSPGHIAEHKIRPISAGIAVPIFAFFAAGVDLRGSDLAATFTSPVAVGVMAGLVIGKPLGVMLTAWVMARFTKASLSKDIAWADVIAVGFLAGIGFTVSLLISELAFTDNEGSLAAAKIAVLTASVASAVLATLLLLRRNKHYGEVYAAREAAYEAQERSGSGDAEPESGKH